MLCISKYVEEKYIEELNVEQLKESVKKKHREELQNDVEKMLKNLVEILREKGTGTLDIPATPCWDVFELVEITMLTE